MNRVPAALCGLILGIAALPIAALAQDEAPTVVTSLAQQERGGAGQDGIEIATGDGAGTIVYGSVDSGDATTGVPPAPPTPPDLSRVPGQPDDETTIAPPAGEPVADPGPTAPDAGLTGDATLADPAGAVPVCGDFPSWYDAQLAYEAAGGAAGDPALVNALDPDADGIACEERMVAS